MGLIVDLVIILIIGLCTFLGYKKGLAKCLLKLATTIIAIFLAILLFRPLVDFVVNHTIIDENIQLSFEKALSNGIEDQRAENNTNPKIIKEDSGIPKPIVEYLNNNFASVAEEKREDVVTSVARSATILVVDVACFIAIFVIAKILLLIITIIGDLVTKLPVIKQCNEVGGIIFGVLQGVLIVLIVMTLIAIIAPLTGAFEIANFVQSGPIAGFFYNNNIILNFIF